VLYDLVSRIIRTIIYYVTERAVFQLTDDGLKLIEIAPGLDLEKDVLANLAFQPIIADDLKMINRDIYQENWGGLQRSIQDNSSRSEEHTSELQSRFDLVCRL